MAEGSQTGAPLLLFEHQKVSLNSKYYQLNSTEYQNSYKRYYVKVSVDGYSNLCCRTIDAAVSWYIRAVHMKEETDHINVIPKTDNTFYNL